MIKSLDQEDFRKELYSIQYNLTEWMNSNFNFDDEQKKYLETVPLVLMTYYGFQLATVIGTDGEILLETPDVNESHTERRRKKGVKIKIEGGGTWNWAEEPPKLKFKVEAGLYYSI